MITEASRRERLVCWALALGVVPAFLALVHLLPSLRSAGDGGVVLREVVLIAASAAGLWWLARRGPLSAAELGLRRPGFGDLGWGLAVSVAGLAVGLALANALFDAFGVRAGGGGDIRSLATRPPWLLLLIALTAAISEETVFRAVLIPAVEKVGGGRLLAVLASALSFAGAHVGTYGAVKMAVLIPPALLVALLFLRRRSLAACIVCHLVTDVAGLAPFIFRPG